MQLPGFMSNALALPAAGIFLLCSWDSREAIHDEFLSAARRTRCTAIAQNCVR